MSTENTVITRDYSDNFAIKQTVIDELGEKYFPDLSATNLNIGQLGFTLEQVANITEDSFNTASIFINEAFPNKAIIPESIFSHAAIFQIDNTFKFAAACSFIMLLNQSEILKYGTTSGGITKTYIDKGTIITIEDIPFTLDYDIEISASERNPGGSVEYLFSAKYITDVKNDVSDINDPYLKIRKTPDGMLLIQFTARQVERLVVTDNVISNTKLNYSVLEFTFNDALAGFDISYKAPTSTTFVPLDKRVKFSIPIKTPFCFYRLKDSNTLEITFSTREGYFQPEFNSEINITMYTTKGTAGNFDSYTGNNIKITTNSETYDYNQSMTMAFKPVSSSIGGTDSLSLEDIQSLTVEGYSTAKEISTEYDIMAYFYNFQFRYGDEILVLKRRDDLKERLFSAFLLIRNDDYIYPTNTANIDLKIKDFDINDSAGSYTLKPGHIFIYDPSDTNKFQIVHNMTVYDTDAVNALMATEKFVYTNPFLIAVRTNPSLVGLYKTITNQTAILDFSTANSETLYQFITSQIKITRGLEKIPRYNISMSTTPSSSTEVYITNLNQYEGNNARVIAAFLSSTGEEIGYIELFPTFIAPNDPSTVTFSAYAETNDLITSLGEMYITNAIFANNDIEHVTIPISGAKVSIYILYKETTSYPNKFIGLFPGMEEYSISNQYVMSNDGLTFIEPLNMMRSNVTFTNTGTPTDPELNFGLSLIPMLKADILQDIDNFNIFVEKVTNSYNYMEQSLPLLRNNTNIDIKFYNTYGKSNNYYIGTDGELIDRVNISIKFIIKLVEGTDTVEAKENLITFIKSFIEKIDPDGTNALYISNLIRDIEINFPSVQYLKFRGINDYSTDYQAITVIATDISTLTKEQRINYVPEMIAINPENVEITFET